MDILNQIMIICGCITAIGGASAMVVAFVRWVKKPKNDIDSRLHSIESDVSSIKKKLDDDYSSIKQQRNDINLIMRSMLDMIENKLTGNNLDGLKKTRDELLKSLTD